jgi:hypothetical protein
VAWVSGALFGPSIIAWRFASLLCGAAGLVFAFRLGLTLGSAAFGILLAVLLASFPPYVAASVFARQYGALVASALLFVWLFAKWADERQRSWPALLALACATLLHPIGIALAGLPIVFAALDERMRRTSAVQFAFAACAVVAFVSCLSYGAHVASLLIAGVTVSPDTAIYAIPSPSFPAAYVVSLAGYPSWITAVVVFALLGYALDRLYPCNRALIVVCAVCGLSFQLGVMLLVSAIAILVRPNDTRRSLFCFAPIATMSIVWWSIHTAATTDAQLSFQLAVGLAKAAASYPLGRVRFTLDAFPAMSILALLGCAVAMSRPNSDRSRIIRGLAVLALSLLGAFELASLPVAERYLLLPWTLLAIVATAGVTAISELASLRGVPLPAVGRFAAWAFVAAANAWLLGGHYRYGRDRETLVPATFAQQLLAPVTGPSWAPEQLRALVAPSDTIVCTEELACLYLVGRVDYLFALPPTDVAHYVVSRAGTWVGFYAGAPVISTRAQLEKVVRENGLSGCAVVVSLHTGKVGFEEYKALVTEAGARFDSRVLFSSNETHVSRMCGSEP